MSDVNQPNVTGLPSFMDPNQILAAFQSPAPVDSNNLLQMLLSKVTSMEQSMTALQTDKKRTEDELGTLKNEMAARQAEWHRAEQEKDAGLTPGKFKANFDGIEGTLPLKFQSIMDLSRDFDVWVTFTYRMEGEAYDEDYYGLSLLFRYFAIAGVRHNTSCDSDWGVKPHALNRRPTITAVYNLGFYDRALLPIMIKMGKGKYLGLEWDGNGLTAELVKDDDVEATSFNSMKPHLLQSIDAVCEARPTKFDRSFSGYFTSIFGLVKHEPKVEETQPMEIVDQPKPVSPASAPSAPTSKVSAPSASNGTLSAKPQRPKKSKASKKAFRPKQDQSVPTSVANAPAVEQRTPANADDHLLRTPPRMM